MCFFFSDYSSVIIFFSFLKTHQWNKYKAVIICNNLCNISYILNPRILSFFTSPYFGPIPGKLGRAISFPSDYCTQTVRKLTLRRRIVCRETARWPRRQDSSWTGRFAAGTVCRQDSSPTGRFADGSVRRQDGSTRGQLADKTKMKTLLTQWGGNVS